jgi:SAM-dependent methyltransferase
MTSKKNTGIGPAGYHQQHYGDRGWQAYSYLLAKVVKDSQPGRILDLGAGCGYFIEAATRWGISSVGLEGSTDAVEMAKKRAPELDIRLQKLGDIFPFENNSFQTVVLNQVIEHLEPEVVSHMLTEANRVLCPGGMIFITSPSCFNKAEFNADPTHINLLSPSQLRDALVCAGFENIVPFDSPLPLLGESRLGKKIIFVVFKITKFEILSATANSIAYKKK